MNARCVFHTVSFLLVFIALAMASCALVSFRYGDPTSALVAILVSAGITLLSGLVLWYFTRGPMHLSRKDGFGVVAFGWLAVAHFGALPYLLTGDIAHPVTAIFEAMSGFTTTGASALDDVDSLQKGILFWRSMTQWLGGMGVVILCVAILPFLGVGGMQIYRAEMPGPSKDRLAPRIATTAKLLWGVYIVLSGLEILLLKGCGMNWFDAACHSFATMSTGGFSTHNESVAAFRGMEGVNAFQVELVIVVFMFLAGANFALHFRAMRGQPTTYLRDPEFRFYVGVWVGLCGLLTLDTWSTVYEGFGNAMRASVFQATAILTTTGFSTEDFDAWSPRAEFLLMLAMICGACAGSTSGGIKIVRMSVIIKKTMREVHLFMTPRAVVQVRLGRTPVSQTVISNISAFVLIFAVLFVLSTFVMTFYTPDLETASSSVLATLCNIGPGFGEVGPTSSYAGVPIGGQIVLTTMMLLGRLELYTVLVLLLPSFWRK